MNAARMPTFDTYVNQPGFMHPARLPCHQANIRCHGPRSRSSGWRVGAVLGAASHAGINDSSVAHLPRSSIHRRQARAPGAGCSAGAGSLDKQPPVPNASVIEGEVIRVHRDAVAAPGGLAGPRCRQTPSPPPGRHAAPAHHIAHEAGHDFHLLQAARRAAVERGVSRAPGEQHTARPA